MGRDEALQMCLEYIETNAHERKYVRHAIKEALSQPAQEPVACVMGTYGGMFVVGPLNSAVVLPVGMALYATPQHTATWVGLTDEERQDIALEIPIDAVFITEAKLKEKNT